MTRRTASTMGVAVLGTALGWIFLGLLPAASLSVLVLALYYAVGGTSFNFLYGSLGVFSLAQVVFLAVGGYTDVYLYDRFGVSPWLSLLIAPVVAAVLALPVALASVRAGSGPIITALITLIVAEAIPPILIAIRPLGGAIGLYVTPPAHVTFWSMQFSSQAAFARTLFVYCVLVMVLLALWRRSRAGYYVTAVKDSPEASAAIGIPNTRIRILTFIVSAAIAAPAGVIYAQYSLEVNADLFLSSTALFEVIVVALVGGAARVWGGFVGAILIVLLSNEITSLANGAAGVGPLTFAGVFLLIALIMPRGISGTWAQIAGWHQRRRESAGAGSRKITGPVVAGAGGDVLVPEAPGVHGVAAGTQHAGEASEQRPRPG
jgi:branched-chain amino acid transport system permease protein